MAAITMAKANNALTTTESTFSTHAITHAGTKVLFLTLITKVVRSLTLQIIAAILESKGNGPSGLIHFELPRWLPLPLAKVNINLQPLYRCGYLMNLTGGSINGTC